jgi:hypothetical protein
MTSGFLQLESTLHITERFTLGSFDGANMTPPSPT